MKFDQYSKRLENGEYLRDQELGELLTWQDFREKRVNLIYNHFVNKLSKDFEFNISTVTSDLDYRGLVKMVRKCILDPWATDQESSLEHQALEELIDFARSIGHYIPSKISGAFSAVDNRTATEIVDEIYSSREIQSRQDINLTKK